MVGHCNQIAPLPTIRPGQRSYQATLMSFAPWIRQIKRWLMPFIREHNFSLRSGQRISIGMVFAICVSIESIDSLFKSTTNQLIMHAPCKGEPMLNEAFRPTDIHNTILKLIDTNRNSKKSTSRTLHCGWMHPCAFMNTACVQCLHEHAKQTALGGGRWGKPGHKTIVSAISSYFCNRWINLCYRTRTHTLRIEHTNLSHVDA